LATENVTWGAERIRGELLKLGINFSKRTIQRYLPRTGRPPASPSTQTWAIFLRNHASQIWACDFIEVYNLFFQSLFVFVIIELSSRRIVHVALSAASTAHPTDAWVAHNFSKEPPGASVLAS
jgi:hypothetical protein